MTYQVGDAVRARIDMVNDLTEDGLGCETCARKNDKLIIRQVRPNSVRVYSVSHEEITDRTFGASEDELDPWDGVWDQPKVPA
jgi:hypothetical protein